MSNRLTGTPSDNPLASEKKPSLFGTDGVRGIVGQFPLLPDFVLRLGAATGAVMLRSAVRPTIVVGRDTRQSGQLLQQALTAGLLTAGATIVDVGVIPTPGVAYLVRKLGAQAGIVISASHNPVDQNGIKIFNAASTKLSAEIEAEIEQLALSPHISEQPVSHRFGRCIDGNGMRELYLDDLLSEHPGLRLDGLTLLLDCANGAASWYASECFTRLGAQVVTIHASPTGLNINVKSGSEYIRKYPSDLYQLISQYSANFGMAFDGDADRVVFVDENGGLLDGDHMLGILADYFHRRHMLLGQTVVTTTMRNQGLVNFLQSRGLGLIETPVGDKYVMEKLVGLAQAGQAGTDQVGLGGEQAGHVILLSSQRSSGDGLRTAIYLIRAYLESGASALAELAEAIHKTPQVIASAFVAAKPGLDHISELEQLKASAHTALRGLQRMELRYSGTEPLFRAMLETDGSHTVQELANLAWAMCRVVQKASDSDEPDKIEMLNVGSGGLLFPANL